MGEYLLQHLDYIYFCYGLGFLVLAASSWLMGRLTGRLPIWGFLAAFGLLHGVKEWTELWAVSVSDSPEFYQGRLLLLAASFLVLMEFARRAPVIWGSARGHWCITLAMTAAAVWAVADGSPRGTVILRYTAGLVSALSAAWALWKISRTMASNKTRQWLAISAGVFALYGIFVGFGTPAADFFPANIWNEKVFFSLAGIPVQLIRGVFACWVSWRILTCYRQLWREQSGVTARQQLWVDLWIGPAILVCLAGGAVLVGWNGLSEEECQEEQLLELSRAVASAINWKAVSRLERQGPSAGTPDSPPVSHMLQSISADLADRKLRQVEIFAKHHKNKSLLHYPVWSARGIEGIDWRLPGLSLELDRVLLEPEIRLIEAPLWPDRGTSLILVPQSKPAAGRSLAGLALVWERSTLDREVKNHRLEGMIFVLLIVAVVAAAYLIECQRREEGERERARAARIEHQQLLLEDRERVLRAITGSAQDAILTIDSAGLISFWNESAERVFGWTKAEALGKDLHRFIAPARFHQAQQTAWPQFQETGTGGAVGKTIELAAVRKDGTEFPIELSLSAVELDGSWQAVGIVRDITDRKKYDETLQRNLKFVEALINAMPAPIFYKNSQGVYLGCNHAFAAAIGKTREEIIGKTVFDVAPPDLAQVYQERDDDLFRQGGTQIYEAQMRMGDGSLHDVVYHKALVDDRRGEGNNLVGVILDVTDRKQIEEALRVAKDAAELGARVKSQFIANLSHEIRTPMNGIIGTVSVALSNDVDSEQRELLEMIKTAAYTLLRILNDILDFSKLEAGKFSLASRPFALSEVLGGVYSVFRGQAEERQIELLIDQRGPLPSHLRGDDVRLSQVLMNLVGNAVKFTRAGGVVVLLVQSVATESAERRGRAGLEFAVIDSGIGIPKEQQRKIFDAFTQADGSTTREAGGTGLGLTISQQIVRLMGGELSVRSAPGAGSVFHFSVEFELGSLA